jgi:L-lactate dehydrogenase complex protein LldG
MRAETENRSRANAEARAAIMQSIRANLAESARVSADVHFRPEKNPVRAAAAVTQPMTDVELFQTRVESVGGHCIVVRDSTEAVAALGRIISDIQDGKPATRVALSDAPMLSDLAKDLNVEIAEVCPTPSDLFSYDVGITMAQAGIAETGTLVLQAEKERHRLVSLLPPVHVALLPADRIFATIGEALAALRGDTSEALSRAITFITGPSRTADIELTLTIGVHGPKELYVILIE